MIKIAEIELQRITEEMFGPFAFNELSDEQKGIILSKLSGNKIPMEIKSFNSEAFKKAIEPLDAKLFKSNDEIPLDKSFLKDMKSFWEKDQGFGPPQLPSEQATPENTYWVLKGGKKIKVCEMATVHLFNALVLLYDKSIPDHALRPEHVTKGKAQIKGGNYKDVIKVMFMELAKEKRDAELTEKMLKELAFMQDVVTRKLN